MMAVIQPKNVPIIQQGDGYTYSRILLRLGLLSYSGLHNLLSIYFAYKFYLLICPPPILPASFLAICRLYARRPYEQVLL